MHSKFMDFKATFYTVNRKLLFYKHYEIGVTYKFVNIIRELYRITEAKVWYPQGLTKDFYTYSGFKQGFLLSIVIFTLFINDIIDNLEEGLWLKNVNVKGLMYADDLVIFSSSTKGFRRMINNLHNYC